MAFFEVVGCEGTLDLRWGEGGGAGLWRGCGGEGVVDGEVGVVGDGELYGWMALGYFGIGVFMRVRNGLWLKNVGGRNGYQVGGLTDLENPVLEEVCVTTARDLEVLCADINAWGRFHIT